MSEYRSRSLNPTDQREESHDFICALLIFYLLWEMPIVALYMNTYVAMVLMVFLVAAVFLSVKPYKLSMSLTTVVVIYLAMTFLRDYFDNVQFVYNLWSRFLDFIPIVVGLQLVLNKSDKVIKKIVPLIIITYAITAVTTYIGLETFPDASRELATGDDYYLTYYKYNIGGFGFIYSLVVLHPLIVCVLRRKNKVLAVLFTLCSALCVFKSAYTTAALLFLASCVVYLFPLHGDMTKAKKWIRVIVIGLVFLLFLASDLLDALAEWDLLESSSEKLKDVAEILRSGSGPASGSSASAREEKYDLSIQAFLNSPIFGNVPFGGVNSGGHSFLLDSMADWGIFGAIMVVVMYLSFRGAFKTVASGSSVYYFSVVSLGLAVVLGVLNPELWTMELGLAIPFMMRYVLILNKEQNNDHG